MRARCRIRRKIGRSSDLLRLSAPNLQACFEGVELHSESRQRQSKTIEFSRTRVAPVHPFPVDNVGHLSPFKFRFPQYPLVVETNPRSEKTFMYDCLKLFLDSTLVASGLAR
jgi:hypothetical protein